MRKTIVPKASQIPDSWEMIRVDQAGAVRLGRQRSPDKQTGLHTTKYVRAANITPAGLDLSDILEMDFTPRERLIFALVAGDVLLTEASGSGAQVGRAVIWAGEIEGCCYQNTVIRFRPHLTIPEYALIVFRHFATAGVFARAARGVGIQHLGASRFAALPFPLPPQNEQRRIATVQRDTTLLVHAAAGGLGSALTRWAKRLGCTVIGTAGSLEKADLARTAGADHVIVGRDADIAAQVGKLTDGRGVDFAVDGIGGDMLRKTFACVRRFGTIASVGQAAGTIPLISAEDLGPVRSLSLARPSVMAYAAEQDTYPVATAAVIGAIADGILQKATHQYPLTEAAQALHALETGKTTGSLVLVP